MSTDRFTSSVKYSFYFGIILKLVTFTFNQLLVKFISPSFLAFNNFLDFIVNSITFFTGEGIRLSIQRLVDDSDSDHETKSSVNSITLTGQSVINLSYIPVILLLPVTLIIFYLQFHGFNNEYLSSSTILFCNTKNIMILMFITLFIAVFTEPFYNSIVSWKGRVEYKTKYESYGLIAGCFFNFVGIVFVTQYLDSASTNSLIILVFTLGKLLSTMVIFYLYFSKYKELINNQSSIILLPKKIKVKENFVYFDPVVIHYFKSIFFQLIFKNFLTEGDKFVFNYYFSFYEQGIYSIINNYGSLVARMILNPLEENLRAYLSKIFSHKNNKINNEQIKQSSSNLLLTFTKYYTFLSVFLIIFGYSNSDYLVKFIFSKILKVSWWNSTDNDSTSQLNVASLLFPKLTQAYIVYLPFMAFNGILEAFCQSISTPKSIQRYSYYLSFCSLVFLCNCHFIIGNWLHLGLVGLVVCNIINMVMRIFYCSILILGFFKDEDLHNEKHIFKNPKIFVLMTVLVFAIQSIFIGNANSLVDIIKSSSLALVYLLFFALTEFI